MTCYRVFNKSLTLNSCSSTTSRYLSTIVSMSSFSRDQQQYAISLESIKEAHDRIREYGKYKKVSNYSMTLSSCCMMQNILIIVIVLIVHKTPVMTSNYVDQLTGQNIHFKCEFMQKTGSFKARGNSYCTL